MKKKIVLLLAMCLIGSTPLYASSTIYFKEQYIVSPKFSIKPAFNTGDGKLIISPRFSIKPAFNSGLTKYFYSGVFSIIDMPDVNFTVDGKPLIDGVKVKDTSKIRLNMDFNQSVLKDRVTNVVYYVENITDSIINKSSSMSLSSYIIDTDVAATLEDGKTYRVGQITTLDDGMKYETKTISFKINDKGLIEFIKPTGNTLFENYITVEFDVQNNVPMNTYNIYVQKTDGSKVLVGSNLKFTDTKISDDTGFTRHSYRYKLNSSIKSFKHIIERIN